ncbi:helix-turn-helix domain-containing protein [Aquimarina rhabdastrellae]
MNFISKNILFLVKEENISKDAFGKLFNLKRGNISSYINGKAMPKLETLIKISSKYDILIDDLIHIDLSKNQKQNKNVNVSLHDFSQEEIIKHLYIKDEEFSKNPLLWMYIKMKLLDDKIGKEEDLIYKIKSKQAESLDNVKNKK